MAIENYLYGDDPNPIPGTMASPTTPKPPVFTPGGGAQPTTVTPGNPDTTVANWRPGQAIPPGYEVYTVSPNQISIRPMPGYQAPAGATTTKPGTPTFTAGMTPQQVRDAVIQFYASKGVTPNPTSVDYWVSKWGEFGNSDPGYFTTRLGQADEFGGGGSLGGGIGYGSLINRLPTAADLQANPGFQYGMDEALRGLQAGAAARGTLLNGRTQQAISQNLLNYALGQQYIPLAQLGLSYNQANTGNLLGLAGLGLTGSNYGSQ